jgi:hypothetical protein
MIISLNKFRTLKEVEYQAIKNAYYVCRGVKTEMAKWLGVSVKNIHNKLKKYPEIREMSLKTHSFGRKYTFAKQFKTKEEAYAALKDSLGWRYASEKERMAMVKEIELTLD